jgi:hypothetical protein
MRGNDDERLAGEARTVNGTGNGLAHHGAHGAADEAVFHGAEHNLMRSELTNRVKDGVVEAGCLLRGAQTSFIWLNVSEVKRIIGAQAAID